MQSHYLVTIRLLGGELVGGDVIVNLLKCDLSTVDSL